MTKYLLDSNCLLLLLVGLASPRHVGVHRRLKAYEAEDFNYLVDTVSDRTGYVTLPYILAEVSNLLRIGRTDWPEVLEAYSAFVQEAEEDNKLSRELVLDPIFSKFGITDTAIAHMRRADICVITQDHGLFGLLSSRGATVLNIWHQKLSRK